MYLAAEQGREELLHLLVESGGPRSVLYEEVQWHISSPSLVSNSCIARVSGTIRQWEQYCRDSRSRGQNIALHGACQGAKNLHLAKYLLDVGFNEEQSLHQVRISRPSL